MSPVDWFTVNLPRTGPIDQIANITALPASRAGPACGPPKWSADRNPHAL